MVLRDEQVCTFLDTRPVFKGHVMVATREHVPDLLELPRPLMEPLLAAVQSIARAMETGLSADGSFTAVNTKISQSVPHLHVHIVPRRKGDGLFAKTFQWIRHPYPNESAMRETQQAIRAALNLSG